MPVLLRIENMLDSQLSILNESFNDAIKQFNYRGQYRGVYPIKVNQQQQVIEEIMLRPMPKRAFVSVEELGGIVEFLASDVARNVTGQWIAVDGGWTCQ